MSKTTKAVAISIGVFLALVIAAYAVTSLFTKTEDVDVPGIRKIIFQCNISGLPDSLGEIAPGDERSMSPVITSASNADMYVFIRAVMPKFGDGGLYEFENVNWTLEEAVEVDGKWVEVYRYDDFLTPESTTTPMCSGLKMVDMGLADYAQVEEFGITFGGYACGTDDTGIEEAWSAIRENYGL